MEKSEVVGAVAVGAIGVGLAYLLVKVMSDSGTSGAAEITSGLANIGEVFGGGMKTGLAVTSAIPVATALVGAKIGEACSESDEDESLHCKAQLPYKRQLPCKKY